MIIKANSIKGATHLAAYLLAETDRQCTFVLDHRGAAADDLETILRSWELEALTTTKGEKPLYHVKIRLAPGETIERGQWFRVLEVLEEKLSLQDQPRAVVVHNLDGEAHLHVVYSRLDVENGRLLKMSHDRRELHATARELEKEFGLRQLNSAPRRERNGNDRTRSMEHRMAKESGTSREALCAIVKAAWQNSETGVEFQRELERFGITMTSGDRRDYNVWHNGKRYDPVRLIENVRTAEFRAKMELDPPHVRERDAGRQTETVSRTAGSVTREELRPLLPVSSDSLAVRERARELAELLALELAREAETARRQAKDLTSSQANSYLADEEKPKPRRGRPWKWKAPAPRLRPKIWYGDPGI